MFIIAVLAVVVLTATSCFFGCYYSVCGTAFAVANLFCAVGNIIVRSNSRKGQSNLAIGSITVTEMLTSSEH